MKAKTVLPDVADGGLRQVPGVAMPPRSPLTSAMPALCIATSVPVPMAMPISAAAKRGRVVRAVAGHRDDAALRVCSLLTTALYRRDLPAKGVDIAAANHGAGRPVEREQLVGAALAPTLVRQRAYRLRRRRRIAPGASSETRVGNAPGSVRPARRVPGASAISGRRRRQPRRFDQQRPWEMHALFGSDVLIIVADSCGASVPGIGEIELLDRPCPNGCGVLIGHHPVHQRVAE